MKKLVASSLLLLLAACGGAPSADGRPARPIDALRARVAENPEDAELLAELAAAELLWEGGDIARARPAIDRALALRPDDPSMHFLSALEHEQRGRLVEAFEAELLAIDRARTSSSPHGPAIAEVLIGFVGGFEEDVPDHRVRLERAMAELVDQPGQAGMPAHLNAASTLAQLARRRGDAELGTEVARRAGCIQSVRAAGPFGSTPMISFDRPAPAEGPGPLADRYELGAERGRAPTRELTSKLCSFNLASELDPDLRGAGIWVVEAMVDVEQPGPHVLLVETPNTFRAHVNGEQVAVQDRRTETGPTEIYVPVMLEAGRAEIEVVIATDHPNPFISLALAPRTDTFDATRGIALPEADDALSRLLSVLVARRRGDPVEARERMRTLAGRDPTSTLLILQADVTLRDPFLPNEQARDTARRLLERAARLDPEAWYPAYRAAFSEQGAREAIALLQQAADRFPHIATVQLEMAEWLLNRGRTAEADAYIARAREHVPTSCAALTAEIGTLRRRGRREEADRRIDELLECDARSTARLNLFRSQRRWDEMAREIDRLSDLLEPEQVRSQRISHAVATGDDATARRLREEIAQENDRSFDEHFPFVRIDNLLADGQRPAALHALEEAIDRAPSRAGGLRRIRRALGGEDPFYRYRIDGAEAIRAFEASGRRYDDASQVLVLDYMVVKLHEDGSAEELVHQIYRVQSEEAIEALGQISLPGYVLTLRSIKPDGRRLEPDSIAGLSHIEMPSLAIGDYVEYEFVQHRRPGPGGSYRSAEWVFQNYSYPFDLSRLVLVAPPEMPIEIEARGPVPEPVETRDGELRVLTWTVQESRPLTAELHAATSPERLPHLTFGVRAGWEPFFERLIDSTMASAPRDPAAERLVGEILGERLDASVEEKARRLHRWVLENIEDGNSRELAPLQLAARAGSRNLVLRYLLELAGIEARLATARVLGGRTPGALQRDDVYGAALVMLRREDGTPFFATAEDRKSPFGYIHPALRGQEAIVLEPGAPRVRIGDQGSQDLREIRADVTLLTDGSARIEVEERLHGLFGIGWRGNLEQIPEAELERLFEEGYLIRNVGEGRLHSLAIEAQDDLDAPLVLRFTATVTSLARHFGGGVALIPLFTGELSRRYASLPSRETVATISGIQSRVQLRVRGPGRAEAPSAELSGPNGAQAFQRTRTEGDALVLEREVHVPPMLVSPDAYRDFARFCQAVDRLEAQEIRFQR